MKGVIDMHVLRIRIWRLRAYDDFELMEAAIRVGARAIVIKTTSGDNHGPRISLQPSQRDRTWKHEQLHHVRKHHIKPRCRRDQSESRRYRTSSWSKSCLAPDTVRKKSSCRKWARILSQCVEVVKDGKIVPELRSVLELVRDHNAVLGTAHIAPDEIFTVVEAARDLGVKNIVITHPEWWIVGMSHEDQLRLVKDYNVILERCYAQNMGGGKYKSNLADNLEIIKEVGYRNVMVDTDGGQTENPHWELALAEYMQYLVDHGIPEEHVYHMTHTIPASLLGINEQEESAC